MRIWIPLFLILILLAGASVPFAEGYFFRQAFYRQIAFYQDRIKAYPFLHLNIDNYALGWRSSVAKLSLTVGGDKHSETISVDINIKHGPFIYVEDKWQHLFAYLESTMDVPASLAPIIKQKPTGKPFMQFTSEVAPGGDSEHSVMVIQPMIIADNVTWDGFVAKFDVQSSDHQPIAVKSTFISDVMYASTNYTNIRIGASINEMDIKVQPDGLWGGKVNLTFDGINITSDYSLGIISLKYSAHELVFGTQNGKYNCNYQLKISSLNLPIQDEVFSSISDIKYSLSLNDINTNVLAEGSNSVVTQLANIDMLMKLLTSTTSVQSTLAFKTKAGTANITWNDKLGGPVTNLMAFTQVKDAELNITVAKPLFEALLIYSGIGQPSRYQYNAGNQQAMTPEQAKKVMTAMVDQGIMTEKDDNYLISLAFKSPITMLNGKEVNPSEVMMNINKMASEAYFACYKKKTLDGIDLWLPTDIKSNLDCYKKDSCFRGAGAPNSGCYKWSRSPNGSPLMWDVDNTDTGQQTSAKGEYKRAYFASVQNGAINVCDVDNFGTFNNCAAFKVEKPRSIILNKNGTMAYIPNFEFFDKFTICKIRSNGALFHCVDNNFPKEVLLAQFIDVNENSLLTITGGRTYKICGIKEDGHIGDCVEHTFDKSLGIPKRIATNKDKSILYLLNDDAILSICNIQKTGILDSCKSLAIQKKTIGGSGGEFAINSKGTILYKLDLKDYTLSVCPLDSDSSPIVCKKIDFASKRYYDILNVTIDDDDSFLYLSGYYGSKVTSCPLNNGETNQDSCITSSIANVNSINSMYVIGSIKPKSVIKSVTFNGDAVKPIVTVTGSGFDPKPSGIRASIDANSLDFGKSLHFTDTSPNPRPFSAGYNDEQNGRHDAIGLVVTKYTDTLITFTFGNDYDQYYKSNTYKLNQGDKYIMYVNDAMLGGVVDYRHVESKDTNKNEIKKVKDAKDTKDSKVNKNSDVTLIAQYFIVPKTHPDVGHGIDNMATGLVETKLGPNKFPVASKIGKAGVIPSGPITDLNDNGEIMWWSENSKNGITIDKTVEETLPLNNMQMFPSGKSNDAESYRSAHYHGTFTLPKPSTIGLTLGADDDCWVFIDGKLVADAGGVKALKTNNYEVEDLAAGKHTLDIFYIDRYSAGAGIVFFINFSVKSAKQREAEEQNW